MSEPVHISTVMREIMEKFKPNRRFKKNTISSSSKILLVPICFCYWPSLQTIRPGQDPGE